MGRYLIILLLLLVTAPAMADTEYYVAQTAAGAEDCSAASDPCTVANIPWSTIETDRDTQDVYIYLKGGDTFPAISVLNNVGSTDTYLLKITSKSGYGTSVQPKVQVSGAVWYGLRFKAINNLWINDIEFEHANNTAPTASTGIRSDNSSPYNDGRGPIMVTDCTFSGWGQYAIAIYKVGDTLAERTVISGNTCTDVGNCIYIIGEGFSGGSYGFIDNNTCTRMNWNSAYGSYDGHCVGLQTTNYYIVEDNTATQTRAAYIMWCDDGFSCTDNIFRDNTSDQNELVAFDLYHDGTTGDSGTTRNLMYGNISKASASDSVSSARPAFRINSMKGNNYVFNNTIYDGDEWGLENRRGVSNSYWWNNIVVVDDTTTDNDLFYTECNGSQGATHDIDYNLYWTLTGTPESTSLWNAPNDCGTFAFSGWQTDGWDSNSPTPANPSFEDTTNFGLTSGSPAIDAGRFLTTIDQATGSGTSFTVSSTGPLHHDFGLTDANGTAISGMLISLYDATNGIQNTEITNISGSTVTVADTVSWTQNTTQIALRIKGTAPDIGAVEFQTPSVQFGGVTID
jgi:hypothetical protein